MLKNKILFLRFIFLGISTLHIASCMNNIHKPPITKLPIIEHIEWGEIIVSHGKEKHQYQDCKIWLQKSKSWDWKECGTHHKPGIQIAALKEFIDEVDIVILSQGMDGVLQVPQETIDFVKSKGKECIVGRTGKMVTRYNQLVKEEGRKVGGLFHSTC